jgi:hypothetical protein
MWVARGEARAGTPLTLGESTYALYRGGGDLQATFEDVPAGLKKVATLEGVVKLRIGKGTKTLEIADALGAGKRQVTRDGITLAVTGVHLGQTWYTLSLTFTRDGRAEPVPVYSGVSPYGLVLSAPDGTQRQGRLWGSPRLRRTDGGKSAPVGPTKFLFHRQPETLGPWTLRYTMPARTVEREYRFTFTDVPLP